MTPLVSHLAGLRRRLQHQAALWQLALNVAKFDSIEPFLLWRGVELSRRTVACAARVTHGMIAVVGRSSLQRDCVMLNLRTLCVFHVHHRSHA